MEPALQLDGGVVDEHVDSSQLGRGRRGDLLGGLLASEVDRGDGHLGVAGPQLASEPGELGLRASHHQQVRALSCERPCDVRPDAVRGPSENGVARVHDAYSFQSLSETVGE